MHGSSIRTCFGWRSSEYSRWSTTSINFHADDVWALDAEELLDRYLRVSSVVCQAIEAVVLHYASRGIAGVIEGCWVLPELAVRKDYAGHAIQAPVKALYLRESSLEQLSDQLLTRADGWHARQPKSYQNAHALMQWQFGREVNRRAEDLGLPVIDSRPLNTLLERALAALDLASGFAFPPPTGQAGSRLGGEGT